MSNQEILLGLIRLGIGNEISGRFMLNEVNHIYWGEVQTIAYKQGVTALVMDGVDRLPESNRPPKEVLLNWIGEVLQGYEYRFQSYCNTMAELSSIYHASGIKMMVLKGYACGLNWPKPEHRPYGDIDIYLFGKFKEADDAMRKQGVSIDKGLHHHTVFTFMGEMVENHFDFVNVHSSRENKEIEGIFKNLASDDSYKVKIKEQTFYLPSPNLHALFLLKHAKGHFTSTSLTLRQLLDWGFFVKENKEKIDWNWLLPLLDKYHLREFFNCINAICVEDLGFSSTIIPYMQFNPHLKNRMLKDCFEPEFSNEEPKWFLLRIVFKYRRWKANAWKRRFCNEHNDLRMFVRSAWKHMLKPASI